VCIVLTMTGLAVRDKLYDEVSIPLDAESRLIPCCR
jgi:hypothetical protein